MDDTLPHRLAADLDGCFEELVRSHQDFVFSVALRLTFDRHEAEDVAQETLVRAYRAMTGYDAERIAELRLRPWLARIALNVQRNRARRRRDGTLDRQAAEAVAAPVGEQPDAVAVAGAGHDACRRLLDGLAEPYRMAVVLRFVEGLSYAEVAEALERPLGTVKAQVHRGVGMLREAIARTADPFEWRERA